MCVLLMCPVLYPEYSSFRLITCTLLFYWYRLAQKEDEPPPSRNRPLYDIPYMFEAREFMRKKLIGKKVSTLS